MYVPTVTKRIDRPNATSSWLCLLCCLAYSCNKARLVRVCGMPHAHVVEYVLQVSLPCLTLARRVQIVGNVYRCARAIHAASCSVERFDEYVEGHDCTPQICVRRVVAVFRSAASFTHCTVLTDGFLWQREGLKSGHARHSNAWTWRRVHIVSGHSPPGSGPPMAGPVRAAPSMVSKARHLCRHAMPCSHTRHASK